MPEPKVFEKIDNIFQCILVLGDDSEIMIQIAENQRIIVLIRGERNS